MSKATRRTHSTVSEVRFGQVGMANLRLLRIDPQALEEELLERVNKAPQLLKHAALILDLGYISEVIDTPTAKTLLEAIRHAGMLPVALAYGTQATETLARSLNLPVLAGFREAYQHTSEALHSLAKNSEAPLSTADDTLFEQTSAPFTTRHHAHLVRSGQQLYARATDLVVTAHVANGAEVIADGSIHVYGALRGRALAGAQGLASARIYSSEFRAELVSIAGCYRVFERIPAELEGQSVQCWLQGETLHVAKLQR